MDFALRRWGVGLVELETQWTGEQLAFLMEGAKAELAAEAAALRRARGLEEEDDEGEDDARAAVLRAAYFGVTEHAAG